MLLTGILKQVQAGGWASLPLNGEQRIHPFPQVPYSHQCEAFTTPIDTNYLIHLLPTQPSEQSSQHPCDSKGKRGPAQAALLGSSVVLSLASSIQLLLFTLK